MVILCGLPFWRVLEREEKSLDNDEMIFSFFFFIVLKHGWFVGAFILGIEWDGLDGGWRMEFIPLVGLMGDGRGFAHIEMRVDEGE